MLRVLTLLLPLLDEAGGPRQHNVSVSVDLVVLHASVRDSRGRFAEGLEERHFAIYEDGVRQTIRLFRHEDIPVTVGLVVDHSGSMRPKMAGVVKAARAFVASSGAEDEMFVVNFNEKVTLGLPPGTLFTDRADLLANAISGSAATGMTALYDAMAEGLARAQLGNRDKKALVVVSDGADNASKRSLDDVLAMAGRTGTLIYTIGVFQPENPDRNPEVLRRVARTTGGEAYFPGGAETVEAICNRVARDLRSQYTLGYVSSNAERRGVYRAIRLTARAEGKHKLAVRTRAGYIQ